MSSTPTNPNGPLTYITDLIPPNLLPALAITTPARYIALYWTPAGDEATWFDGRTGGDCNWWAYQSYFQHILILNAFTDAGILPWALGSSDTDPTHWAILDTAETKLYAAPVAAAEPLLHAQWPALAIPDDQLSQLLANIDWTQIHASLAQHIAATTFDPETIHQRIAENDRQARAISAWLEERTPPTLRWTSWSDAWDSELPIEAAP